MAISKLILNGEVQMDVTSDTVMASSLLSGKTATKNDGTKITGNIVSKSSDDLTVSDATVTAPAGYYANAASKAVATTTHPNPTAAITSSTGVVTASHTQGTGYVTGGTTTGTLNLTTQAGKTVTPTESAQTAVASYKWTTGPVSVAAISSTYVGTGIITRSAADLTASDSNITTPAGYYSSAVSKAVAAGSAFPPAVTITKAPTFSMNSSTGVITASYTGSSSITPTVNAGYVSQGTAGTISTTGTSTYTLTTQGAQTITPGSTAQTIASNRWLTGTQTIAGDSNLTAANIAEGVSIFGVTGTHSGGGGHDAVLLNDGMYDNRRPIYKYVGYNNASYYTNEDTFNFNEGDIIETFIYGYNNSNVYLNNILIGSSMTTRFSAPSYPLTVYFSADGIYFNKAYPSGTLSITSNGTYNVYGYSSASVNIDGFTVDQIATRSISGDISGNASIIGAYAFAFCPHLTTVNFPSCTTIDISAFYSCSSLTSVSFPSCKIISNYAFAYCKSISTASFPVCTTISIYAFASCPRLTTANFPSCTTIGSSAFNYCYSLATVSFPVCTTIGSSAFYSCSSLTTVNFPSCTTIDGSAFYSCRSLTTVNFPSCTRIGSTAFDNCYNLATVSFPVCTTISGLAFANCSSLTTANFPSCTTIGNAAFSNCRSLTTVSFPVCTSIGSYAFADCTGLTTVNFPSCTRISGYAFTYCTGLTTVSFPSCTTIYGAAFSDCHNLLSVYLLGSSIPSLINTTAFNLTPIAGYTTSTDGVYGKIYVPASLYSSYITATYWSAFSSRFVSV